MKVDRVTIRRGVTLNLGNFQSMRFDVELSSADATPQELEAEVIKELDRQMRAAGFSK